MATIICGKHRPEMATVRPMAFPKIKPLEKIEKNPKVIPFQFEFDALSFSTEYIGYEKTL